MEHKGPLPGSLGATHQETERPTELTEVSCLAMLVTFTAMHRDLGGAKGEDCQEVIRGYTELRKVLLEE